MSRIPTDSRTLSAGRQAGRGQITLIGINAPSQPRLQFGHTYPQPSNRRLSAHQAWFGDTTPWRQSQPSMKEPLPTREQAALSYQVAPELRAQLRSGFPSPGNHGRHPAVLDRVTVGAALHNSQRPNTIGTSADKRGMLVIRRFHL